ncbi:hypothetical protein HDU81_001151 [Chytriomyces hyalinus]|nr:hypothetical protein HDU81_001151 [Chytriomyces hyalinus]
MTNKDLDNHSFAIDTPPYTPSPQTMHQQQYTQVEMRQEAHSTQAAYYTPPPLMLTHSFSLPSSQQVPHPLPAPAQIRNAHRARYPTAPSASPTTTRMCKIDSRAARVVLVSNLPDSVDDRDVRAFLAVMPFGIAALNHVKSTRSAYIELTSADQVLPFISTFNGAPFVDRFISCTVKKPFNSNPHPTQQGHPHHRHQYPPQTLNLRNAARRGVFQVLQVNMRRRGFSGVAAMRGVMCANAGAGGVGGSGMHDVRGGLGGVKMFPVEWIISGFVPFEQVDHLLRGKAVKSRRKSFGKFGDTTEIPPDVGFALCQILSHAN